MKLPQGWVVERTFAWLEQSAALKKDYQSPRRSRAKP